MKMNNRQKRIYLSFNPKKGYPAKSNLYYECLKCGYIMPSLPQDSGSCICKNITIDIHYGRIDIKDHSATRLFSLKAET
jgi:hypothetical protein